MAGSVNKVILVGNLGRDPEVRYTQDGTKIVHLAIATSERWRDRTSGENRERTEWHRVVIFNERLGEVAEKYLAKGRSVYLEGQLQTRKWQDQSGQERYSTEVVLQRFRGELVLLGGRDEGSAAAPDERESDWGSGAGEPARGGGEPARGRRPAGQIRRLRRPGRRDPVLTGAPAAGREKLHPATTAGEAHGPRETLELVDGLRPVLPEQAREGAIGQQLAAGLAARAVVGLVVGVADALDGGAADRARLPVAAVHRHVRAKGGHLLGEVVAVVGAQPGDPVGKRRAGRLVQARDLFRRELVGHGERRQARAVQDLVGIGVADAAEQARVGERALERVVLAGERAAERREVDREHLEAARVVRRERVFAPHEVQRCPLLRARIRSA